MTRFLLEIIRTDERGLWDGLTISQNVSILVAVGMLAMWGYVQRQPAIPDAAASGGPQSTGAAAG